MAASNPRRCLRGRPGDVYKRQATPSSSRRPTVTCPSPATTDPRSATTNPRSARVELANGGLMRSTGRTFAPPLLPSPPRVGSVLGGGWGKSRPAVSPVTIFPPSRPNAGPGPPPSTDPTRGGRSCLCRRASSIARGATASPRDAASRDEPSAAPDAAEVLAWEPQSAPPRKAVSRGAPHRDRRSPRPATEGPEEPTRSPMQRHPPRTTPRSSLRTSPGADRSC